MEGQRSVTILKYLFFSFFDSFTLFCFFNGLNGTIKTGFSNVLGGIEQKCCLFFSVTDQAVQNWPNSEPIWTGKHCENSETQ